MSDVQLMLVIHECKGAVEKCEGSLDDRLLAAMNAAKGHWMVLDKDTQFRGAVGAVMQHYGQDSDEYKRMAHELESLRKFSAFIAASQAGLSTNFPEPAEDAPKPIGMMGLWHQATKAA